MISKNQRSNIYCEPVGSAAHVAVASALSFYHFQNELKKWYEYIEKNQNTLKDMCRRQYYIII